MSVKKWSRQDIWRHNQCLGSAAMIKSNASAIMCTPTTTDKAKNLAHDIYALSKELKRELKIRRDP